MEKRARFPSQSGAAHRWLPLLSNPTIQHFVCEQSVLHLKPAMFFFGKFWKSIGIHAMYVKIDKFLIITNKVLNEQMNK